LKQDCSSKPKDQTIDSNEASEQLRKDFQKIAHFWWHKETTLKDKKKLVDAYLFLKQHTSALIPRMMLRFEGILYAVRNQTGKEYPAMQVYIRKIFEAKFNKGLKDTELAWCMMEYTDAKATITKREFYRNYHPHIKDAEALVGKRYQRICKKN
jgi:hypothetical protein